MGSPPTTTVLGIRCLIKGSPSIKFDIAKKMSHSTAAATGLVDRLEKLGYVERVHAAEDRRKIMVRITNKGVQLVSKMRSEIANDLAGIIASFDEDQADALSHTKRAIKSRSTN